MKSELIKKLLGAKADRLVSGLELVFSTDSRSLGEANAFICLYGERFDAFDLIEGLSTTKIKVIFYEDKPGREALVSELSKTHADLPQCIGVPNIFDFLLEMGSLAGQKFKENGGKIIGLTGSNGKTTNKEMLAWLLEGLFPNEVLWTKGNLNNHIGVPLTLLRLQSSHRIAIIEMGTNHPGEIEVLARTAAPTVGMITNVGHAHLEFLKDLKGVFQEKTALFREVEKNEDSLLIINEFDRFLKTYQERGASFRLSPDNFIINKSNEVSFSLVFNNQKLIVKNSSLLGNHQKTNMGQCLALCLKMFPNKIEPLVHLANSFEMPAMNRGDLLKYKSAEVFLDAYNANPDSMKASLESFKELARDRGVSMSDCLFVLGDMNELGEQACSQHRELGKFLSSLGGQNAIFIGQYGEEYKKGFGEAQFFSTGALAKKAIDNHSFSLAFIKGSRSLQLESILAIKEE